MNWQDDDNALEGMKTDREQGQMYDGKSERPFFIRAC